MTLRGFQVMLGTGLMLGSGGLVSGACDSGSVGHGNSFEGSGLHQLFAGSSGQSKIGTRLSTSERGGCVSNRRCGNVRMGRSIRFLPRPAIAVRASPVRSAFARCTPQIPCRSAPCARPSHPGAPHIPPPLSRARRVPTTSASMAVVAIAMAGRGDLPYGPWPVGWVAPTRSTSASGPTPLSPPAVLQLR